MSNELEDSGNHGAARPWIVVRNGEDRVDHAAILSDFAHALRAAAERCEGVAERVQGLGPGPELDALLVVLRGFLRRTISSQIVAFSVLGDDLSDAVNKERP